MRWDRLFEDLDAQWDADQQRQRHAEVADRTRRERALITLTDRLAAQQDPIEILLRSGRRLTGRLADLGSDFVVIADGPRRRLIPTSAIVQYDGLTGQAAGPKQVRAIRRYTWGYALRALARDRATIMIDDAAGRTLTGTIDAVGADFVDIVEHPADVSGRQREIRGRRTLPTTAVMCLSTT
ncbi:hypothetical protein KEM60_03028 [Austwickia sp. TVS 96-490-7B]|uniref:hypothetical protein n=1 Tax=Austwickia sp. TVS 96-490-7B TaxID=2830843 RepID=UPI001C596C30|nr:hypothetical protein [Austwickia sp. TVS 96-490-7B]MBW3086799.1 hypothetical protein [Austwickia sp. TVS 96-490-7B]